MMPVDLPSFVAFCTHHHCLQVDSVMNTLALNFTKDMPHAFMHRCQRASTRHDQSHHDKVLLVMGRKESYVHCDCLFYHYYWHCHCHHRDRHVISDQHYRSVEYNSNHQGCQDDESNN